MTMRRSFPGLGPTLWLGLANLALLASGCGDPFAAPSRPKSALTTEVASAKSIFMIVPGVPKDEVELWAIWAQREANDHQMVFRATGPGPAESGQDQPEFVRKALADGASALLVVPGDSPDLARALADAEGKGVPVVLLGRTIPAPAGSRPFHYVTHAPFEDSAGRIVATALEDAKKADRPANGSALILADKDVDATSTIRVAALKSAAEAAGLRQVDTVPFDGLTVDSAKRAVIEAVKSHPDVAIVLADDAWAMKGASDARVELKGKPAFFVGGYIGHRAEPPSVAFTNESCFVDGKTEQLGRLAARKVIARLQGEPVDERSTPQIAFTRGSAEIAAEVKAEPSKVSPKSLDITPTAPSGGAKPP